MSLGFLYVFMEKVWNALLSNLCTLDHALLFTHSRSSRQLKTSVEAVEAIYVKVSSLKKEVADWDDGPLSEMLCRFNVYYNVCGCLLAKGKFSERILYSMREIIFHVSHDRGFDISPRSL